MRLMDLLTEAEKNKLQGIAGKRHKKKKKKDKNGSFKKNKKDLNKPVVGNGSNKKNKSNIDNDDYRLVKGRKKRHIEECPYCASIDLEITSNGYYYCCDCGFKVEKI